MKDKILISELYRIREIMGVKVLTEGWDDLVKKLLGTTDEVADEIKLKSSVDGGFESFVKELTGGVDGSFDELTDFVTRQIGGSKTTDNVITFLKGKPDVFKKILKATDFMMKDVADDLFSKASVNKLLPSNVSDDLEVLTSRALTDRQAEFIELESKRIREAIKNDPNYRPGNPELEKLLNVLKAQEKNAADFRTPPTATTPTTPTTVRPDGAEEPIVRATGGDIGGSAYDLDVTKPIVDQIDLIFENPKFKNVPQEYKTKVKNVIVDRYKGKDVSFTTIDNDTTRQLDNYISGAKEDAATARADGRVVEAEKAEKRAKFWERVGKSKDVLVGWCKNTTNKELSPIGKAGNAAKCTGAIILLAGLAVGTYNYFAPEDYETPVGFWNFACAIPGVFNIDMPGFDYCPDTFTGEVGFRKETEGYKNTKEDFNKWRTKEPQSKLTGGTWEFSTEGPAFIPSDGTSISFYTFKDGNWVKS